MTRGGGRSVKTEADFCPPAGDGAPARKNTEAPAEDEAPVTPLLHPEAPVTTGGPCYTRAPCYDRAPVIYQNTRESVLHRIFMTHS